MSDLPDNMSDTSAAKILDVVNSTLDSAASKDDPDEFLYLLGIAMGALSHLAYDVVQVQQQARTGQFGRFHLGFDNGIATAEGVQKVFLTDQQFEKVEAEGE